MFAKPGFLFGEWRGTGPKAIICARSFGSLSCSVDVATAADRPKAYDEMIAHQAEIHGLPEALVHRIVKRESRYQPGLVQGFGLMQIKYATAREMGYKGDAKGLRPRQHYALTTAAEIA